MITQLTEEIVKEVLQRIMARQRTHNALLIICDEVKDVALHAFVEESKAKGYSFTQYRRSFTWTPRLSC